MLSQFYYIRINDGIKAMDTRRLAYRESPLTEYILRAIYLVFNRTCFHLPQLMLHVTQTRNYYHECLFWILDTHSSKQDYSSTNKKKSTLDSSDNSTYYGSSKSKYDLDKDVTVTNDGKS
jgi:hypothetical protein